MHDVTVDWEQKAKQLYYETNKLKEENAELKERNQKLKEAAKAESEVLKEKIKAQEEEIDRLDCQNADLNNQLNQFSFHYDKLKQENENLEEKLKDKEKEINYLNSKIEHKKDAYAKVKENHSHLAGMVEAYEFMIEKYLQAIKGE